MAEPDWRRWRGPVLAAGMDSDDAARVRQAVVEGGQPLAPALAVQAEPYEREGAAAAAAGRRLTARDLGLRAALARHFAAVAGDAAAAAAARAAYARLAPALDPPAVPVTVDGPGGSIAGYARGAACGQPLVVIVAPDRPGREELRRYEDRVLARGAATLGLDPPPVGAGAAATWDAVCGVAARLARDGVPIAVWTLGGAATALAPFAAAGPPVAAVAVTVGPEPAGTAPAPQAPPPGAVPPVAVAEAPGRVPPGFATLATAVDPMTPEDGEAWSPYALDLVADWLVERLAAGGAA
jgi:hypothetical protein